MVKFIECNCVICLVNLNSLSSSVIISFLSLSADICRVCRSEGTPEKPLYHPCVCTGSIKFIHQECLVQWLKHSRKEYCELCKHRFAFTPSKYVLLFILW
uniref:E3 ubiquitin-protein ligase MARCHF6 n=1 Tax=Malurus cyaneus samueli TaxID=2593467 RepID=A0A8C5T808_9PASS